MLKRIYVKTKSIVIKDFLHILTVLLFPKFYIANFSQIFHH
jgi:hypothetical protein